MSNIVFIGCGKSKLAHKSIAKKLYTGSYFSTCLEYAKTLTTEDKIYILSAKYGVLPLDKEVEPYDRTLNKMTRKEKQEWKQMVIKQLKELGIKQDEPVTFICGRNYYNLLTDYFIDITLLLQGFSGMGLQKQFMTQEIKASKHKLF